MTHAVTSTDTSYDGDSANSVVVSVTDDDDVPVTVSFALDTYTVAEGDRIPVTVSLNADPERTVVIPITTTNQGATSSTDYSVPTSVTFDAGETSRTITVWATQDTENDDGESVRLGFEMLPNAVSAGTTATTTVSITDDDDPQVTVSYQPAAYTVPEGDVVTMTVTLSADPERTLEIPIRAFPIGTTSHEAFSDVPKSVTFNRGETEQSFTVTARDDSIDDDNASVRLAFGPLPDGVSAGTTATAQDHRQRSGRRLALAVHAERRRGRLGHIHDRAGQPAHGLCHGEYH